MEIIIYGRSMYIFTFYVNMYSLSYLYMQLCISHQYINILNKYFLTSTYIMMMLQLVQFFNHILTLQGRGILMRDSKHSFVHDQHSIINNEETFTRFSGNSEGIASELQEMFSRYYIYSDMFYISIYSNTHPRVIYCENIQIFYCTLLVLNQISLQLPTVVN